MSVHNTMITIFAGNCNQISQSFYDSVIFDLPLHQLTCSCGHSACLSIHVLLQKTYTTGFLNKTRVKNNGIVPQNPLEQPRLQIHRLALHQ